MRRGARWMLLAGLALGTSGCEYWYNTVPSPDDLMHVIPWFDHMIRQKSVHPYARADIPRNTVPGTVPITGGEADWGAEFRSGKTTTADAQVNPFGPGGSGVALPPGPDVPTFTSSIEATGDTLFHTYCEPCHGNAGAGDGPISRKIGAPSLLTAKAKTLSDGYIYSMIRYGRGVMPRYGDKLYRPADRWAVVTYVRKLQAAAPDSSSTGGRP
ncbi:MAG TPA: cytochrome c [Gemmatimonadales bacterium]|nr:cytochrome c [Gemmatimonadales bacterium]